MRLLATQLTASDNPVSALSAPCATKGIQMHQRNDPGHLEAMQKMRDLMKTPEDMSRWQEARRKEFEALPEE